MRGNNGMNSDPESLQAFETLLEESLAVHPEAESRVLDRLSIGLQKVTVYKPAARETIDLWQHALKTAVMIALAVGLFAMVGRREHSTSARVTVGEDGGDEKKARPKPPPPVDEKPDARETKSDDPFAVLNTKVELSDEAANEKMRAIREASESEASIDSRGAENIRNYSTDQLFKISLPANQRIKPDALDNLHAHFPQMDAEGCVAKLKHYYSTETSPAVQRLRARRGNEDLAKVLPNDHYVSVPGVELNGDAHKVVVFCRCGYHPDFCHVLFADGHIAEVHKAEELQELFRATAKAIHLNLEAGNELADVSAQVSKLGDDDFSVREAAEQALIEAGAQAVPALETGTKSEDPERASRCKRILSVRKRNEILRHELGLNW